MAGKAQAFTKVGTPEDVGTMIPLRNDEQEQVPEINFGDVFNDDETQVIQDASRPVQMEQVREPASTGGITEGDILNALNGPEPTAAEISESDILAALDNKTKTGVANTVKARLKEQGYFQKLFDRAITNVGRNPKERYSILSRRLGKDNVRLDGDNLMVKDKSGKFVQFDPDSGIIPDSLEEFSMDIADIAGDVIEGAVSALGEAGLLVASGVTGGPVGLGAGIMAAGGAGAAVSKLRGEAVEMVGGVEDEEYDNFAEGLFNAGLFGIGSLIKQPARFAKRVISDALSETPGKIIDKVAIINKGVDDIINKEIPGYKRGVEQVGIDTFGVIEKRHKELGKTLGLYKEEAKNIVGDKTLIPGNYASKLKEVLEDHYVSFDKTTGAAIVTDSTAPLGGLGGSQALEDVVSRYNDVVRKIHANQGFNLEQMDKFSNELGGISQMMYSEKKGEAGRVFKELSNALASDKNIAISDALKGTPMAKKFQIANDNYRDSIENVREISKIWRSSQENGEIFVDNLVKKGNATRVNKLKILLGEDSKQWKELKAVFLNKQMENVTSLTTGIFDANKFIKNIDGLGKEVWSNFFSESEFRKIRKLAIDYEKLGLKDIVNNPSAQGTLTNFAIAMLAPVPFAFARARAIMQLTKGNKKAADYLLDRGFVDIAERAINKKEKNMWMDTMGYFSQLIKNSKVVKRPNGREVIVETPIVRSFFRSMLSDGTERPVSIYETQKEENQDVRTGNPEIDIFLEE